MPTDEAELSEALRRVHGLGSVAMRQLCLEEAPILMRAVALADQVKPPESDVLPFVAYHMTSRTRAVEFLSECVASEDHPLYPLFSHIATNYTDLTFALHDMFAREGAREPSYAEDFALHAAAACACATSATDGAHAAPHGSISPASSTDGVVSHSGQDAGVDARAQARIAQPSPDFHAVVAALPDGVAHACCASVLTLSSSHAADAAVLASPRMPEARQLPRELKRLLKERPASSAKRPGRGRADASATALADAVYKAAVAVTQLLWAVVEHCINVAEDLKGVFTI